MLERLATTVSRQRLYPPHVLLLGIVIVTYAPVWRTLLIDCWHDDNYSHVLLVPVLAAYLAFRPAASLGPQAARRLGVFAWVAFLLGSALLVLGSAAAEQTSIRLSALWLGAGLLGLVGGPVRLARMAPALLLLLSMIPWPYTLYYRVTFPLQLFSAQVASGTLDLMGFDVIRWGNVFQVNGHALEVVRACSGLRSMMTLGTLALALVLLTRLSLLRGVLLICLSAPVAMFGNTVRLVATSILVVLFGSSAAEGLVHDSVGVVTFLLSTFLLGVALLALRRGAIVREPGGTTPAWPRTPRLTWAVVAATVVIAGYGSWLRFHTPAPDGESRLSQVPREILGMAAVDLPLADRIQQQVGADDYVFRVYESDSMPEIGLYVGYYRSQRQGAQIHSPQHCYPGAGWQVTTSDPLPVRGLTGQVEELRRMVVEREGRRDVVVYWYDTRTGRLSGDLRLKWNLLRTALLGLPQDAAFVRWSTPIDPTESVDEATRRLLVVAARALPYLEETLPFKAMPPAMPTAPS